VALIIVDMIMAETVLGYVSVKLIIILQTFATNSVAVIKVTQPKMEKIKLSPYLCTMLKSVQY